MPRIIHNLPTVLLRHDLPDGTHHFDWMIAQDAAGEGSLTTFRLPRSLVDLSPGESFSGEQIDDHRPKWLEFEGEVSGDRGRVRRMTRGMVLSSDEKGDSRSYLVEWEGGIRQRIGMNREKGSYWRLISLPLEASIGHNRVVGPSLESGGN